MQNSLFRIAYKFPQIFAMRTGPIRILPLKPCGDAGIWTRGLLHAKQALYRWATSPTKPEAS